MANVEYKRIVTKHGNGVPTIPPSASHDTGDWIATDIYDGELYIDDNTGSLYTSVGGVISKVTPVAASEKVAGIAEIATQEETDAGTDDARIVTPLKLKSWWSTIKTLAASISGVWTFVGGNLRISKPGAASVTAITTSTSSDQSWSIPDEGNQTFASRAYADGLVTGLWDDRGAFDASVNAYPSAGGSGSAGAILKGDVWTVSVAGTLPTGQVVEIGDIVRAIVDTPGNTQANWAIQQNNIGYTAENSANKVTSISGASTHTQYNSAKLLYDQLALKEDIVNKNASGGYVGLSGWSIAFRNLANTFTSLLQNAATAARTYVFPDKDITVAGLDDTTLIAAAGGTVNAITATYSPALTLTDGKRCYVVASGANTSTIPTFEPDGLTAHTITKKGGVALLAGDISAALHVIILEYNLANTRWELLNPAKVNAAADVLGVLPAANGGSKLVARNYTPTSGTNTTGEEVLHAMQVAASVVASGDYMEIYCRTLMTNNTNNKTWRIYFNTASTLDGNQKLLATFTTASVVNSLIQRFIPIISDTSVLVSGAAATSLASSFSATTVTDATITVASVSAGFYILITCQKATGTDTDTAQWTTVRLNKG